MLPKPEQLAAAAAFALVAFAVACLECIRQAVRGLYGLER